LQLRCIPESSVGLSVGSSSNLSSPEASGSCPETHQVQVLKPAPQTHNDSKVFDPYALPFASENEITLGLWAQHSQPDGSP
jgi:hypothetical protein